MNKPERSGSYNFYAALHILRHGSIDNVVST